jgi:lysophospholipase L1-like esterase
MIRRAVVLAALVLVGPGGLSLPLAKAADSGGFPFRAGDRVVFLGDSITAQYEYSTYIELYLTTRFPSGKMAFYNAGIGGDTATGGARRFATQVLAEKPTIVTIDFGMNDGGYGGFDQGKADQFIRQTEQMLAMAKKAGVRVALISPNAVEVRNNPTRKTYLETQLKFYAPLKELAAKYDVQFVDQYALTRTVLEKLAADDAKVKPFPDSVHTGRAGGLLMAHAILAGLHAPAEISGFTVDVAKPSIVVSHCEIGNHQFAADHVTFDRTDNALPMPVLKEWRDLLPYVDQLKDLNDYGLKVIGLKPGKYELRIDDEKIATYTAEELAAGINVGNAESGPIYEQGMKVLAAINAKNNIVKDRFWQVVNIDPKNVPSWVAPPEVVVQKRREELAKRDELIAAKQAEVYRLAAPVKHHWELKAAD